MNVIIGSVQFWLDASQLEDFGTDRNTLDMKRIQFHIFQSFGTYEDSITLQRPVCYESSVLNIGRHDMISVYVNFQNIEDLSS